MVDDGLFDADDEVASRFAEQRAGADEAAGGDPGFKLREFQARVGGGEMAGSAAAVVEDQHRAEGLFDVPLLLIIGADLKPMPVAKLPGKGEPPL